LEKCNDVRLGKVVSKSLLAVPANEWKEAFGGYREWASEKTTLTTILLDEIQVLYTEPSADDLWSVLKLLSQKSHEQQKVRVACFASYGEKAGRSRAGTPFDFEARFGHELLRIDEAGVRNWIKEFNQHVVGYSAFPLELDKPLWFMTRGHIGLVARTMWTACNKFKREVLTDLLPSFLILLFSLILSFVRLKKRRAYPLRLWLSTLQVNRFGVEWKNLELFPM